MLSIEGYIERNFTPILPYGNPTTDYRIDCPYCSGGDSKQHLYVSLERHVVHCFRCGYKSTWIGFVIDTSGLDYVHALAELYVVPKAKDFASQVTRLTSEVHDAKPKMRGLPDDFCVLRSGDVSSKPFMRYLKRRGFTRRHAERYQLGYAPSVEGRLIIPVEDEYWQGRSIYSWLEPKYLNPKAESKCHLFNSEALELYNEVVICEGCFSAMAVGENALALVGKEAPPEKLERLIASAVEHFIITVEPDAWTSIQHLAQALHRNGKRVTLWKFQKGDPAEPDSVFTEVPYNSKTQIMYSLGF
jgi:hypothetical protein